MKKNIYSIIGVLFILGVATFGYTLFTTSAPAKYVVNNNGTPSTKDTATGTVTPGVTKYTLTDVASHDNTASCYSVVSGSVYDLTLFVSKHEGGSSPILSMCGKDGTDAFMTQHKGAAKIMRTLSRFKIGELS